MPENLKIVNMKRFFVLLTIIHLQSIVIHAQQKTEDSVKAAVNKLFEAMKTADGAKLKTAFSDSAILQTISSQNGTVKVRTEPIAAFADIISKLPAGDADERIHFESVKIDGDLASVWTPYKFYYKGKFSHCGVNSFQLIRLNGEWKIQYIIDTRRKEGCE